MAIVDFSALNAELDNLAINIQKVADALGSGTLIVDSQTPGCIPLGHVNNLLGKESFPLPIRKLAYYVY